MKIKCCRIIDFQKQFGCEILEDDDRALDNGQQIAFNSACFHGIDLIQNSKHVQKICERVL